MILNEHCKVKLNASNVKKYNNIGYIGKVGDEININIKDLTRGSHSLISVRCDLCGIENEIKYNQLIRSNNLENYVCKKCKNKTKLLEKYGVDNVFKLHSVKEKIKQTNINKYGVENPSQSKNIKEKKKITNKKKYGHEWGLSSEKIKNKTRKTLIEKYGVDNISKLDDIKTKKKNTCFSNYGVSVISQTKEFRDLYKNKILNFLKDKYNISDYDNETYLIYREKCSNYFRINKKSFQTRKNFSAELCTICNPIGSHSSSGLENEIKSFLNEFNIKIETNVKNIISPQELDIYLPEQKIAFEFNGLYWHSELFKSNNYHQLKTEKCEEYGISLIQIYEDDWLYKKNIVKSRILNLLGLSEKIYARKCEIKEVSDNEIIREFLEKNHIQGYVGSIYKIGLFHNDELISLMTFGKQRKPMNGNDKNFELIRFCNKLNISVIGGASKLFKYFIRNYNPIEVISYADRSWSKGNLYEKLGFSMEYKTKPNYYYIINGVRKYRFNYRKDKLIKEGFDKNKTEHQIMLERNIFRIYDSGNLKYKYIN